MPMKPTIFILCFILFTCYKNSNARDHNIPDVKTFTFKEAGGVLEDTVFFKSKKIIPLETNDLALIGQIDRICMAEESPYESYEEWQAAAEKELKGYQSSLATIAENKKILVALETYISEHPEGV